MRKDIIIVTCLILVVCFSVTASAASYSLDEDPIYSKLINAGFYTEDASDNIDKSIPQKAKETISNYFGERLKQYGDLVFDEKQFSPYINFKAAEKTQIALKLMESQIEIFAASGNKLGFSNFDFSIDYVSAKNVNSSVTEVCLYLNYDIEYNGFEGITSSVTKEPHKITLLLENDNWFICKHEMFTQVAIALEKIANEDENVDIYLSNYEKSMIERNGLIEMSVPANVDDMLSTTSLESYNRSDACRYARTYANSDNPSPWYTFSADCTNFVSIALRKGGLPQDSSGSNTWYWNSRSDRSASWAGAKYLRTYLINNNSSSSSNTGVYATSVSLSSCSRGDVVSFESGGDIYHNAILTSYTTSGGWLLCQHSHSQGSKDVPLQTVIDWEDATVRYTHIVGYY